MIIFISESTADTERFAAEFSKKLKKGTTVFLYGEMGSGKTAFVSFVLKALGCTEPVTSPTFALRAEYDLGSLRVAHYDLYRLNGFDDLYSVGFYDEDADIVFVEWAERTEEDEREENGIYMKFEYGKNENERIITYSFGKETEI